MATEIKLQTFQTNGCILMCTSFLLWIGLSCIDAIGNQWFLRYFLPW